jgi:hypothetical protein
MWVRSVIVVASFGLAFPATAAEMKPEDAKRFVSGKLFAYTCFEGTTGQGRIQADGSVAGTISIRGTAAPRYIVLPPNTIRINPQSICAAVKGVAFQPCFNVQQTSQASFRGSLSGFGFAYCDFVRVNSRVQMAKSTSKFKVARPVTTEAQPVQPVVAEALPPPAADTTSSGQ